MTVLEVKELSVSFTTYTGLFRQERVQAIERLDLDVRQGEVLAVIGASGSGKSLLAHAILGILPANAHQTGEIRFDGELLTERALQTLRGSAIAFIPQSVQYLDPLMNVGTQVRHSVRTGDPVGAQRDVFRRYRLQEHVEAQYPHQLSGGMARHVLVSTAVVSGARLLVADEPTPGLDPDVAREAMQQLRELADDGAGVLLISHDMELALAVADRVAVFYAGTVVELAQASDFAGDGSRLRHPYSKSLWRAMPQNGFVPLAGRQPLARERQTGCLFASRCPAATEACAAERPENRPLRDGMVQCIHAT